MEMAKVTSKGQITIPISIRRRLEINEGGKILFINTSEGVMMVNPDALGSDKIDELSSEESVSKKKPPVEEVSQEIAPETANVVEDVPASEEPEQPVEQPKKSVSQMNGLDLGSLIDDIRSIGSKI